MKGTAVAAPSFCVRSKIAIFCLGTSVNLHETAKKWQIEGEKLIITLESLTLITSFRPWHISWHLGSSKKLYPQNIYEISKLKFLFRLFLNISIIKSLSLPLVQTPSHSEFTLSASGSRCCLLPAVYWFLPRPWKWNWLTYSLIDRKFSIKIN